MQLVQLAGRARHAAVVAMLLVPSFASGQAVVSDKGTGVATLQYIYFTSGDHLFSTDTIDGQTTRGYTAEGNRWYLGDTTAHTVLLYVDYGLFHRFGVSGTAAWVSSKYEGRAPVNRDVDDGAYHASFQDFGVDARYMLLTGPLDVSLSAGVGAPMTSYANYGHAAVGRSLAEIRGGIFLAYDWIAGGALYGSAIYGVSEELEGINLERITITGGTGYNFGERLFGELFAVYVETPNGVDWVSGDPSEPEFHGGDSTSFSSLAAVSLLNIGASAHIFTPGNTVVALTLSSTVWGENVEDGVYAALALTYRFGNPRFKDEWGEDW